MRRAESLNTAQIALVLCQYDLLPSHLKDEDIATLPYEEWPTALSALVEEIVSVKVAMPATEDDVEVTATDEQLPQDDEDRHVAVENLVKSDADRADVEAAVSDGAPRVDAPEVAENAAVSENTPGYIAMPFPKISPFGCGDYHECRQPLEGPYKFADWGRHVMQRSDV